VLRPRLDRITIALSGGGAAWRAGAQRGRCSGAPLEAFAQALRSPAKRTRLARVLLGSDLVRSLVVPWPADLEGDAEAAAYAEHQFRRVFGEGAGKWSVRFDGEERAMRLACAIDTELLTGMRDRAAAAGCRIDSVQPFLVDAFNRWRAEFSGASSLFIAFEPGRWSCAQVADGEWRALRGGRLGEDAAAPGLVELVARERAVAGSRLPARIYAPAFPGLAAALRDTGALLLTGTEEPLLAPAAH
jgi:hypothetical protein